MGKARSQARLNLEGAQAALRAIAAAKHHAAIAQGERQMAAEDSRRCPYGTLREHLDDTAGCEDPDCVFK